MLLTGTFTRSLDDKLRFSIPKMLRDPDVSVMYLAPGTDGSLALYAEQGFSRLAEQLGRGSPTSQDVRAFSRLFYAQAQRVEIDRQGRVRIPLALAQLASLNSEIVLLGVRDHLEIWDLDLWRQYWEAMQPRYDQIAESAFQHGPDGPIVATTGSDASPRDTEQGAGDEQPKGPYGPGGRRSSPR